MPSPRPSWASFHLSEFTMPRFKAQLKNGNLNAHVSLLYGGNPQEAEADLERKMGKQSLFSVTIEEDPTDYFIVVLMAKCQSGDYFPEITACFKNLLQLSSIWLLIVFTIV